MCTCSSTGFRNYLEWFSKGDVDPNCMLVVLLDYTKTMCYDPYGYHNCIVCMLQMLKQLACLREG